MTRFSIKAALTAAVAASTLAVVAPAGAQDWNRDHGGYDRRDDRGGYDDHRGGRYEGKYWRGRDGRYYCHRSNGTTGLLIGGVGGAVAGGAIGGDALGTIVGAGAGALLGRAIDRNHVSCR